MSGIIFIVLLLNDRQYEMKRNLLHRGIFLLSFSVSSWLAGVGSTSYSLWETLSPLCILSVESVVPPED